MKRSFTFSFSRKVSTAPYENADAFASEGIEVDDSDGALSHGEAAWDKAKAELVSRVRAKVDAVAREVASR